MTSFSFAIRTHSRGVLASVLVLLTASFVSAQSVCLPAPRLLTTLPMGGQIGTELEVTITGQSIEDAAELRFSHPAITATPKSGEDGKPVANRYVVRIADNCPVGIHEARVMTRLGLSTARVFTVGELPEVTQSRPNTTLETAMNLQVDSICNGVMSVKQVDHYRFEAKAGQRIAVDCAAKGIDSKLNAVLIVGDSKGRDLVVQRRGDAIDFQVPRDDTYTIKVHELTFKGGAGYFYRLSLRQLSPDQELVRQPSTRSVNAFSWPPADLPIQAAQAESHPTERHGGTQSIELPCDIAGSFFPAADVDTFQFEAKKGDVWWVEVASERLGLPTDPSVLVQRVIPSDEGDKFEDFAELSDIPSPVKVSSNGYSYDGPPYNAGSSDVMGKLEFKEDGLYRLQLTDLFGGTRKDPRNKYRLIIRRPQPDFALVAWGLHMNLRNGDRNALSKPIALRGGSTMALEVVAIRRDGFDGDIDLSLENLPDGVTSAGLKIPAGKSRGIMLVSAADGAPRGYTSASFVGRATINGGEVIRPCRLASMAWPVPNAWSEIPEPRLLAGVPVSVGGAEAAPITIAARDKKTWEVATGGKLVIPLLHFRRCDFSGANLSLKTFGHGFEGMPAFDVPLTADSSQAEIDLAKLKTPPGEYLIAFYGSAVAKHRHNVDAVESAKLAVEQAQRDATNAADEASRLLAAVAGASEAEKPKAKTASDAAAAKKKSAEQSLDAANKRLQAITRLAQPKDIVDIIVSEPIAIRVTPAQP